MRQLDVLLVLEGSSDVTFLTRVVERSLEDICLREVDSMVNVAMTPVEAGGSDDDSRARWIVDRATEERSTVVLLHRDGSADVAREVRNSVEPVRKVWPTGDFAPLVPVIPVKEMEAWALADVEALESIIGRSIGRGSVFEGDLLGTPERLGKPKRTLQDVARLGVRPRRRRVPDANGYLPTLAENVSLVALRRLPSFRVFENDIVALLNELGWRTRDR